MDLQVTRWELVWVHQNRGSTEFWRMIIVVTVVQAYVRVIYYRKYCSREFKPQLRHAGVSGFDRCCDVLAIQNCKGTLV